MNPVSLSIRQPDSMPVCSLILFVSDTIPALNWRLFALQYHGADPLAFQH
jgi:hypothetical protein